MRLVNADDPRGLYGILVSSEDKRQLAVSAGVATDPRYQLDIACERPGDDTDDEEIRPLSFYNEPRSVAQPPVRSEVPQQNYQRPLSQSEFVGGESCRLDVVQELSSVCVPVVDFSDSDVLAPRDNFCVFGKLGMHPGIESVCGIVRGRDYGAGLVILVPLCRLNRLKSLIHPFQ